MTPVCNPSTELGALHESGHGTDRRSALKRQQGQVSEENRTRQSGTLEAAATAGTAPHLP
jgi:hypothetical protein